MSEAAGFLLSTRAVGATSIQVWTVVLAALAVAATIVTAAWQGITGREQVKAAEKAAEAARLSAKAAQDSVGLNSDTAAGVADRAHADALSKRYQDAAMQLGHEKAPVRLAGAYAMARLADDWLQERQTCVNVLCAYLRMPWPAVPIGWDQAETQVRKSIQTLIRTHLLSQSETDCSWSDLRFELNDAVLRDFDLTNAVIGGLFSLERATFHGDCHLDGILIESRWLNLDYVTISARCRFSMSDLSVLGLFTFVHFRVDADGELVIGAREIIENKAMGGSFGTVAGRMYMTVMRQEKAPGTLTLRGIAVLGGGGFHLRFADATNSEPRPFQVPMVDASGFKVSASAVVSISSHLIEAGHVKWLPAEVHAAAYVSIN